MTELVDTSREGAGLPEPAPEEPERRRRRNPAWWIAGVALVLGFGFVAASMLWNSGKLFAPLDDVYIHLQYGSQLGAGHFFEFNTGDGVSAGASSMLYAFVLGAAYVIGAHGTLLLAFAVGFNICCFAAASALTTLLATRLIGRAAGTWTGLLIAVSGPLLWGSASGMEVGMVMLLVTGLLLTFVTEQTAARFRFTPAVAALLAIARPEGLIFAGVITLAVLWTLWTHRSLSGVPTMLRRALWSLLPGVVGAGQLLFYRLATGTASANGVQAKSLLHDTPVFYLGTFVDRTVATLRGLAGIFLGFTGQDFVFPGALLIAAVGIGFLLLPRANRPLIIAMTAGLACAVVSLSTLDTALNHELRYFQPFFPLFFLFVVAGVAGLSRTLQKPRYRRFALHGALAVVLTFSLVALPTWGVRFSRDGAAIRDTDISYGVWINGHLPADAVVAVKDVGAVTYFSDRYVVDLLGLGTNGFAEPVSNGIGSLYETLRHLPAERRPDYFATYDTGPGPSMAPLRDVGLVSNTPVGSFTTKTPPDIGGILAVPFRQFTVAEADWSLVGNADAAPVSGAVRDYLNVAYLDDERDHDYRYVPGQTGMQPWSVVSRDGDVIDAGRLIVGGETFTFRNLEPGKPATITARAAIRGIPDMTVVVDGKEAGTWIRGETDGTWQTDSFTIPAELITSPEAHVELRQPRPLMNPYPDYTSYAYWVTQ
ncbi:hypothetical protein FPZ12_029090 [Amycolatopsis acidicola]|uniref:4-amino-4-deoxy-L-arabinose transferase n=1 Tax=Amycolatopsis acidicola TaxID=2596893 RepID=A0A5N0UY44_9PSEU|nr:hypothetical protein [Amycolatopsis acidicola]KAA9155792.1 hypothetical protein FPZ12_029090 [Amycolatopsis acidicola]